MGSPPVFMFEPVHTHALNRFENFPGKAPKVIGLVAPVGYGKTVQMAMRLTELRRTGRQGIWFALDDRDTMVDSLIVALEALLGGVASPVHPTQALFRGQAPDDSRIDALVDLVNAWSLPITLFIDNLNCCTDPALGRLLDQLVFGTAPSVQLVLSSTRELPLDLSRAQLQGLIERIGPAELSFSLSEVGQLLGPTLSSRIGPPGLEAVARQTEGWPAAVRLAQIILRQSERPQEALALFSGSDQALAHLLQRQVMSGLLPDARDFLLCISLLRNFNQDLCSEVTRDARGGAHLAHLVEQNLFVIPLDRNRNWYRLHGLFRDFLQREAQQALSADRCREVRVLAARWFERHGQGRDAVDHALASGDVATTRDILERLAPGFVRDSGQVLPFIQWLDELHERGHRAGPESEYWFAWALAFCRRYDDARNQVALLMQQLQSEANGPGPDLKHRVEMLRTSIDSLSDRRVDAFRGASSWLISARLGRDDPFNMTAAHCIECSYFTNAHRFVEARVAIQHAREAAFQTHSAHVAGWVSAYAALIQVEQGDYGTAYPELVDAVGRIGSALGDNAGIRGTLAMIAARCAAEMGLDEEAWRLFGIGAKTSRNHGFLEAAGCGLDAAVLLWRGEPNDRVALPALRDIASAYPPRLSLMLSCTLIQRLVVLERGEEAIAEAERIGLSIASSGRGPVDADAPSFAQLDALLVSTKIALLVATGRFKPAEALIAEESRRAKATHRAAALVQLALVSAEMAVRSSNHSLAVRHVTRAVSLAAPRNIVRPFQDRSAYLATVVADTKLSAWGFATSEERRFFGDRCGDLGFAEQSSNERRALIQDESQLAANPLTGREQELLGYVDAGLSNQQIADRGGVSVTTVKWHFRNIFVKLDVPNRSAALARARVLNLLPR